MAFTSDRSGNQQVWVADRNESQIRRVTTLEGASVNVGSWSPDGRSLALDAIVAGNADIYVVSDGGGPLRRLTDAPARESDSGVVARRPMDLLRVECVRTIGNLEDASGRRNLRYSSPLTEGLSLARPPMVGPSTTSIVHAAIPSTPSDRSSRSLPLAGLRQLCSQASPPARGTSPTRASSF